MHNESVFFDLSVSSSSLWTSSPIPSFPPLQHSLETETVVVGAGITGILTAYLLAKQGKSVVLLEARECLHGVTGNTTAKLTAQHHLTYHTILSTFGKEKGREYYESNRNAIRLVEQIIQENGIHCHYETKSAIVYAETGKGFKKIKKEAQAYETLAIPGRLIEGNIQELPFDIEGALELPNQVQFHPVKFLAPLLVEIEKNGGRIFEHTRAVRLDRSEKVIHTDTDEQVVFDQAVVASHYPFNDFQGLYFPKLSIERSYIIAAETEQPIPQQMYINAEQPTRSLRPAYLENGKEVLLIGGDGHKTGKSNTNTQTHYENLAKFGKKYFQITSIPYHWSAQDMTTLDEVPYIGQMSHLSKDVFVATGFNKWGMTNGVVAASLLSDLIQEIENPYKDLYDPLRSKLKLKDAEKFAMKNAQVAKDFVTTKAKHSLKEPCDLKPGEGGLVSFKGKKAGAYRDTVGGIHVIDATCTGTYFPP